MIVRLHPGPACTSQRVYHPISSILGHQSQVPATRRPGGRYSPAIAFSSSPPPSRLGPKVSGCTDITHRIQTGAESDAVIVALQTYASRFQHLDLTDNISSPLGIAFYSHQETHVYILSRDFRPERTRWITTCLRTTSGERKPCSVRATIDVVAANIVRTIDIPSAQETDCKSIHQCPQLLG